MRDVLGLVDAVAADLNGLSLPAHETVKYLDPPVLRSDKGKVLSVFVRETDHEVLVTEGDYEDTDTIVVAWYVPLNAETDLSAQGLTITQDSEKIIDRLKTYANGIPGVAQQTEATLFRSERGPIDGSFWLLRAQLRVRAAWTT